MTLTEISSSMKYFLHSFFAFAFLLGVNLSFGQPANDDLCNAQMLNVDQACTATNGDNTGATSQAGEPNPSCFTGNLSSVWFSFVAPPSGVVSITTDLPIFGTLFDTEIALYSLSGGLGNCGQLNFLNEIDCNGDVNSENYFSTLESVPVNPGEIHYISVSGWGTDQGSFCIEVRDGAPPPRVYVNQSATGLNNGSSWQDAYTDLQNALQLADGVNPMEVWVASGSYFPSSFNNQASFELKNNVSLIGGFAGIESFISERVDIHGVNQTNLDGDIYQDPFSDNSERIVKFDLFGVEAPITIDGFTIKNGDAEFANGIGSGAGISIDNFGTRNVTDTIRNCRIIDNKAIAGAGLYVEKSSIYVVNSFFEGNFSFTEGGAFHGSEVIGTFINCAFTGNTSEFSDQNFQSGEGGAVFGRSSQLSFFNSSFSDNAAKVEGGAAFDELGDISFHNCTIEDNTAPLGGALYTSGSLIIMTNSRLMRNSSGRRGGSMYSLASQAFIDSTIFGSNQSSEGGGIYFLGGFHTISNSDFSGNTTSASGGIASRGGAIYSNGGAPNMINCEFDGNSSTEGGAIFNDRFSTPELYNCEFTANNASKGGGMFNAPQSQPLLFDCEFKTNLGFEKGGAIYNERSEFEATSCVFEENSSISEGGALINIESKIKFSYCTFLKNTSFNIGGALHNTDSRTQISNSSFIENSATNGGGIFNEGDTLWTDNNTFSENIASSGVGGAFIIYNTEDAQISASTIYKNVASANGGGIYTRNSSLGLNNNAIGGNTKFDTTTDDIYNDQQTGETNIILSDGYNFISDITGAQITLENTDISGTSGAPLDPMLDTLGFYGGPSLVHPPLAASLLQGAGPHVDSTDILEDQRGFSRIVGSRNTNIDIGAFESQTTFITPVLRPICSDELNLLPIPTIIIQDSTGGAFAEGENLSIDFSAPPGIKFQAGQGEIACFGNGLSNCSIQVTAELVTVNYSRSFDTTLNTLEIRNLFVELDNTSTTGNFEIYRSGGNAFQFDNRVEDSVEIVSLQVIPTIKLVDLPYDDNFELDQELWTPVGDNSIWEVGTPSGEIINGAASGQFSWITEVDESYLALDTSKIESPCLDFRGISNPRLGVNIWSDTEEGFDGTVLQQSSDYGKTWNTVGTTESGLNWYNSATIIANPGDQITSAQLGWTGRDSTWKRARISIASLQEERAVRFRFAFASVGQVDELQSNNGFAFDDFSITESNTRVLMEHFTDNSPNQAGDNANFQGLINDFFPNVIPIQYHITEGDEFYQRNPAGPRVRGLYYGVTEARNAIVNGNEFLGLTRDLNAGILERSLLKTNPVLIDIDTTREESVTITTARGIVGEVILYAAVIENTPGKSAVFRAFLPNAGGISLDDPQIGIPQTFDISWDENTSASPSIIDNYDSLRVVVFVQDRETKEVYQTAFSPIWTGLLDPSDLREGFFAEPEAKLSFYPNPVEQLLFLDFGTVNEDNLQVSIIDMQGKWVFQQRIKPGLSLYDLNLTRLSRGMYFLHLQSGEETILQDKIMLR